MNFKHIYFIDIDARFPWFKRVTTALTLFFIHFYVNVIQLLSVCTDSVFISEKCYTRPPQGVFRLRVMRMMNAVRLHTKST